MRKSEVVRASLRRWIAVFADGVLRLCFPPVCEFCGGGLFTGRICDECRNLLCRSAEVEVCVRCAATVGKHLDTADGCVLCKEDAFAFERVYRLGRYTGTLAEACRRIKRESQHRLALAMAELLWKHRGDELKAFGPQFVVPIPLHWLRRFRRGYNQSAEIAAHLAERLAIKQTPSLLRRVRATPMQSLLPPSKRRTNVRNAFLSRRRKDLVGARVLLVDDVLTTGSTCHYAAKALRDAGAGLVAIAVLARGEDVGPKPVEKALPQNPAPRPVSPTIA